MSKLPKGISSYGSMREQSVVNTTSPIELIAMLFDKACVLLKAAVNAAIAGDDQAFHRATLHALQIVLSLRFVLDTDSGSELSESLFGTYTAIAASLKKAREEQDAAAIGTVYEALDELRTAWHSVAKQ
jgi:flagellar biosynthetic protein FliS